MSKIRLRGVAAIALIAVSPAFATPPGKRPNPLLARWPGPYGGVPPFDRIKVSDFKPALKFAMAENLREIEAMEPVILDWGRAQGCDTATFTGRKGWARTFLTKKGWSPVLTMFAKPL